MRYIMHYELYQLKEIIYVEKYTRDNCLHRILFLYPIKLICGKISRVPI